MSIPTPTTVLETQLFTDIWNDFKTNNRDNFISSYADSLVDEHGNYVGGSRASAEREAGSFYDSHPAIKNAIDNSSLDMASIISVEVIKIIKQILESNVLINITTSLIQVQGSPANQANIVPLIIPVGSISVLD